MKVQIIGDNIKINRWVKNLVHDKVTIDLEKYLKDFSKDIKTATVKIKKRTRWGYKVNFNMWLPGKEHIFADATHEDLPSAIVELREKVERQIKEYKGRLSS